MSHLALIERDESGSMGMPSATQEKARAARFRTEETDRHGLNGSTDTAVCAGNASNSRNIAGNEVQVFTSA